MIGLILKDLLNLRKYGVTVAAIIAFYLIFTMSTNETDFITGMIILLFTMMSITSFSYDNLAKWDVYALSLPISKKDMVVSKYLLAIFLMVVGTIISILVGIFVSKIKPITGAELATSFYGFFCGLVLFISVLFPLIYKYGVEKARLLILIVFTVPALFLYLLGSFGIPMPDESQMKYLAMFSPIFLILALFISAYISIEIYKRKEM